MLGQQENVEIKLNRISRILKFSERLGRGEYVYICLERCIFKSGKMDA